MPSPTGRRGALGDRDEYAAVLHECVQVGNAFEAQAAADIVGVVDAAQVRSQRGGLERHRAAEVGAVVEQSLSDAVQKRWEARRDWWKNDHVILRLQVGRGADILVRYIGVRDFAFVQGEPEPAVVLRVDPGVQQGDSWHATPGDASPWARCRPRALAARAIRWPT